MCEYCNGGIMRKLGDQWIEKLDDGKEHILKAGYGMYCHGCLFNFITGECLRKDCPFGGGGKLIIKDLGMLNDNGLLPCPFCGEYPELCHWGDGFELFSYYISHRCTSHKFMDIRTINFPTEQEAIDAWNRR